MLREEGFVKYRLYRLEFTSGVHFGRRGLEDGQITFRADTLFSALYQEALKCGRAELLLALARSGELLISDAFPYMGKQYFLPKPFAQVIFKTDKGNSSQKKRYKKMQYIPADCVKAYLQGNFPDDRADELRHLGSFGMKVSAGIRGHEEPQPYRVKYFCFEEGNGLYILAGCREEKNFVLLGELLESLSYSGLGGKRSAGFGRFEYMEGKVPEQILEGLLAEGKCNMLLSSALPCDRELDRALDGASYQLIKRSGFVASPEFAEQQMRKKDLYIFASGSCFSQKFEGEIRDVSSGGCHPVFRYARAMFMGVDL